MGNDLAKADAVNTALADKRGRTAHDPVTGGLPLAAPPSPRGLLPGVHEDGYPGAMTVASLHVRAGTSIPELAEQMRHSPQMTISTYAHVIRELERTPVLPVEEQILRAREETRGRLVDVGAVR